MGFFSRFFSGNKIKQIQKDLEILAREIDAVKVVDKALRELYSDTIMESKKILESRDKKDTSVWRVIDSSGDERWIKAGSLSYIGPVTTVGKKTFFDIIVDSNLLSLEFKTLEQCTMFRSMLTNVDKLPAQGEESSPHSGENKDEMEKKIKRVFSKKNSPAPDSPESKKKINLEDLQSQIKNKR